MYDRDEARRLLEEELSGTEYQRQFSGPVREAIDRFLQWLQEGALNLGVVDIPAGPLVVLILLAAAITVVLLVVRPRLQRSAAADRGVDIERGITAAELRARADRSAEAGNYDDAARDRFRALVRAAKNALCCAAPPGAPPPRSPNSWRSGSASTASGCGPPPTCSTSPGTADSA